MEPYSKNGKDDRITRDLGAIAGIAAGQLAVEQLQSYTIGLSDEFLQRFYIDSPLTYNTWASATAHGTSVLQGITVEYLMDLGSAITGRNISNRTKILISAGANTLAEFIALNFRDEVRVIDPADILIATTASVVTMLVRGLINKRNQVPLTL